MITITADTIFFTTITAVAAFLDCDNNTNDNIFFIMSIIEAVIFCCCCGSRYSENYSGGSIFGSRHSGGNILDVIVFLYVI